MVTKILQKTRKSIKRNKSQRKKNLSSIQLVDSDFLSSHGAAVLDVRRQNYSEVKPFDLRNAFNVPPALEHSGTEVKRDSVRR